jgi:hypothetical protein
MAAWINYIKNEFATGKTFVEIASNKPRAFHRSLYKASHRRGLNWRFATLENSVFVRAIL